MWLALPKLSLWAQNLKHTFHQLLIAKPIHKPLKGLVLPAIYHSVFTVAAFWDRSDICEYLGGLQMTPSCLDWQTANWKLPHTTSWYVELKMASIHTTLLCFSLTWAVTHHSIACTIDKVLSKMVDKSASYVCIEELAYWRLLNTYRIVENCRSALFFLLEI